MSGSRKSTVASSSDAGRLSSHSAIEAGLFAIIQRRPSGSGSAQFGRHSTCATAEPPKGRSGWYGSSEHSRTSCPLWPTRWNDASSSSHCHAW